MSTLGFGSVPVHDNGEPLVDLAGYPFVLEPAYFQCGWSPEARMYLRQGVADSLARIQAAWAGRHRFKIWDGYRPRSVQSAIYDWYERRLAGEHPHWDAGRLVEAVQRFVTRADDPARIPPHATGGAVDLTLVDALGRELDMGTAFDHFGPEAAPDHFGDPGRFTDPGRAARVHRNRRLLHDALLRVGFTIDETEWWHADLGNQSWALRRAARSARYGEIHDAPWTAPSTAPRPAVAVGSGPDR